MDLSHSTPVSPTRAMATLDGTEYPDTHEIWAAVGDTEVMLWRNRYGTIVATVSVDVLDEQREIPVTKRQAQEILDRAHSPADDAITLARVPKEEYDT